MQPLGGSRVAVLFGTRPEAIKLGPVIQALRAAGVDVAVVTTGQHRELARDILPLFDIEIDVDLALMKPGQSLDYVLGEGVQAVGRYLAEARPDAVVVQGDTSSTLAAALAAFHHRVPLAHVEAGLRTHDLEFPFPEEMNRRATSLVARLHFAPTPQAAANLAAEGIVDRVYVTGNTVVDAARHIVARASLPGDLADFIGGRRYLLATAHRRESWGDGIEHIARALDTIVERAGDIRLVFVTHPNPLAAGPVARVLGGQSKARVVTAVEYPSFLALQQGATVVVSDSGGVQEEGATFGVPVVVTRAITERGEGIQAGAAVLVGTDEARIVEVVEDLLRDESRRASMSEAGRGLYGDGHAASRIAEVLAAALAAPRATTPHIAAR
jgi:UDP-N-acetylglucosamine 2-epimerase (non-hydrolysing)